jgi:hypothetical protein
LLFLAVSCLLNHSEAAKQEAGKLDEILMKTLVADIESS